MRLVVISSLVLGCVAIAAQACSLQKWDPVNDGTSGSSGASQNGGGAGEEHSTGGRTGEGGTSGKGGTGGSSNTSGTGGTTGVGGSNAGELGGSSNPGSTTGVGEPMITSVKVDYNKVCAGDTATITAVFSNGTGTIDNGVGAVESGVAKATTAISADTTFTLTVTNSAGAKVTAPVVVQAFPRGSFTATGSMKYSRTWHSATTLADGRVLVVGGSTYSAGAFDVAEIYDLALGRFIEGKSPNVSRVGHTATLLPNGKVLLAGVSGNGNDTRAELYDPVADSFIMTSGPLNQGRAEGTATLLLNGLVLLAGGRYDIDPARKTLELFNAAAGANGTFALLYPTMAQPRVYQTATLLRNGKVLIAGGCTDTADDPCLVTNSADLYDPTTGGSGSIVATGPLVAGRANHRAALLGSGQVLIVGGTDSSGAHVISPELYDPSIGTNGTFSTLGATMMTRSPHAVAALRTGEVLIAGGKTASGAKMSTAEIYNPATGKFSPTAPLNSPDLLVLMASLPNGMVLLVGGETTRAELYCP
ncbi:MAG: kelch repeat-containing protein [Polyangiaceae bacterium]